MYNFKDGFLNKVLMVVGGFVAFMIFTAILPGVVEFILSVIFIWSACGLAGWAFGRNSGEIEDEAGVPFYKEVKFYEYIAKGPITLVKYFK